jgi:hypothetical protein
VARADGRTAVDCQVSNGRSRWQASISLLADRPRGLRAPRRRPSIDAVAASATGHDRRAKRPHCTARRSDRATDRPIGGAHLHMTSGDPETSSSSLIDQRKRADSDNNKSLASVEITAGAAGGADRDGLPPHRGRGERGLEKIVYKFDFRNDIAFPRRLTAISWALSSRTGNTL